GLLELLLLALLDDDLVRLLVDALLESLVIGLQTQDGDAARGQGSVGLVAGQAELLLERLGLLLERLGLALLDEELVLPLVELVLQDLLLLVEAEALLLGDAQTVLEVLDVAVEVLVELLELRAGGGDAVDLGLEAVGLVGALRDLVLELVLGLLALS